MFIKRICNKDELKFQYIPLSCSVQEGMQTSISDRIGVSSISKLWMDACIASFEYTNTPVYNIDSEILIFTQTETSPSAQLHLQNIFQVRFRFGQLFPN